MSKVVPFKNRFPLNVYKVTLRGTVFHTMSIVALSPVEASAKMSLMREQYRNLLLSAVFAKENKGIIDIVAVDLEGDIDGGNDVA